MLLLFDSHIVVVFLFLLDTFGEGGRRARSCASVISKLRGAYIRHEPQSSRVQSAQRCIHSERRTICSFIVSFEWALPAYVQRRMLFEFAIISCRGDGCVMVRIANADDKNDSPSPHPEHHHRRACSQQAASTLQKGVWRFWVARVTARVEGREWGG